MNDRDLLEMAAKAAGYEVLTKNAKLEPEIYDGEWRPWNPLTDDGDALRLAVKLGLCVLCHATQVEYSMGGGIVGIVVEQKFRDETSTRRAIVRAAAEIGRNKA